MSEEAIYLDHHATTPLAPEVLEAMLPWLTTRYGNPGSVGHRFGHEASAAVEDARLRIAQCLQVTAQEIVFTSGATESNNLALRGFVDRQGTDSVHLVSATTEHKAVLDPLEYLAKQGHQVTLVAPCPFSDPNAGMVSCKAIAEALNEQTRLVSVMLVNNEIGVIQPVAEIAAACRERGALLHCDATQAIGKIPVDVSALDVDLLSFSGHKIYGPAGIGALVVRRRRPRVKLQPFILGGGQERGLRSGTANVAGIVGLAKSRRAIFGLIAGGIEANRRTS